ncbi:hypothetical protein Agub_g1014 [Astrephomene gubernaculifera]|uniref:Uncharacterized protein n=1 Tax=Astrephomene gubernaculifera TaxID=47775 RepID=A0AAD3DI87_9CHLO|nr:hypothetical protein Agub_g1014 [Astrephomene gubernaculifera]
MVQVSSSHGKEKDKGRMVIDATAGAIAGCIARVITGPLDVIKIRFQVQLEPIVGLSESASLHSKYTGFQQALTTIMREEGLPGLWRGTVPGLLLTVPYTAVQFVALQQVRQAATTYGLTANPGALPLISLASGALAGAAATVASYPFDLLRTTLAAQGEPKVYGNMWDAARGIVSQRGAAGLYCGLGVTLLEIMPYAALQFGLYDALNALVDVGRVRLQREAALREAAAAAAVSRSSGSPADEEALEGEDEETGNKQQQRRRRGGSSKAPRTPRQQPHPHHHHIPVEVGADEEMDAVAAAAANLSSEESEEAAGVSNGKGLGVQHSRLQAFTCGLLAGLLAKLATHPLDVAKKRYQVAGLQRSLRYGARVDARFAMRSLGQSLAHIYRTEGVMGLWKGSVPSIIKAAPSAAITFAAYDAVLAWLLVVSGEQQQAAQQAALQAQRQQEQQQQQEKRP